MSTTPRTFYGFEELRAEFKVILQRCFLKLDPSEMLIAFSESPGFDSDKKTSMDQVFRDTLLDLLGKDQECLERYISFCVECCRQQTVTPTMPVVLLGDVFDAFTLDKCEKMFSYVENGVGIWKEDLFFVACKNNLLRMCNDLLRRLSRSQNTIFCGRILLFLAKFFPFSERSGLNIVSEFNLDNVTELGGDNSANMKDSVTEEDTAETALKNRLAVDFNLYCKFWSLQDFFRNPNLCYNKVQWKTFVAHSSCVLSAFGSYKLDCVQGRTRARKRSAEEEANVMEDHVEEETHYFAKFLTNQKLLELQLSDSNFRRCVLVQFLILFQYLNLSVKFKMESFDLKVEQSDWVKETTDSVFKLLSETPPDGKNFANCVKHILKREEHWNTWKNEGCPEFQKLKSPTQIELPISEDMRKILKPRRKRLLGDIIKEYEAQGKFYMGNTELTKLWNLCPDNLEACRGKERDFLPTLESYLWEAMEQCERGVSGPERVVADGSWGWRALRLLARRSPHFFTHSNNPINRLPDYLELMVRRVAKDLPSQAQDALEDKQESPEEEVSEEQMEADLMKGGDPSDVEQTQELAAGVEGAEGADGEGAVPPRAQQPSERQLLQLATVLGAEWRRLAAKLGYAPDEILFYESSHEGEPQRARGMLHVWFQDDDDATMDDLAYILEGLGLLEAAAVLKEPTT